MPLVKHGKELGVTVRVDTADTPILAKVDDVYEWWTAEEAKACVRAEQDVQMGDENMQETGGPGASITVPAVTEKMSHIEVVAWLVQKTVAESEDEDKPKIVVPPSSILHKGCKKSSKAAGKKAQVGVLTVRFMKAAKASSLKWAAAEDNDKVKVVESHMHVKGKAPSLRLLHAEAVELQAAYLHLQVCVNQLAEALEKIRVE
ncbi:hypothetical protein M404DRAFT_28451 [Pisolithus tinctorius Marx 270]|uniref:Uncharacterized protein n=1 Tax=Pisolithus tinctorius Marx 270 TaxID=870435 RepID=A0A0C3IY13_PISTI|nr:hypothetical protein M404DRAFT_28451 [Pisolithus tinctorius Marx 270]